jgi:hypothetical protein
MVLVGGWLSRRSASPAAPAVLSRAAAVLLALAAAVCGRAAAQTPPAASGRWVRVTRAADSTVHEGRLDFVAGDTLWLSRHGNFDLVRLDTLDRVEVRTRHHTMWLAGALVGAAAGAAGGSTSSRHWCQDPWLLNLTEQPRTCGLTSFQGALIFGLVGAGVGVVAGSFIETDVWAPIPPGGGTRLQAVVGPAGGRGVVVGLALVF